MQNLFVFLTIFLAIYIQFLIALPLADGDNNNPTEPLKRSEESFLPNENFSVVTKDKLLQLQAFANAANDPKLLDLYHAVKHYVQLASKNHEYVLWKYDPNREGLVLTLKQNLNGILYYG